MVVAAVIADSPVTVTGVGQVLPHNPPSPTWPVLLFPRAHAAQSMVNARAWVPPAPTDFTPAREIGRAHV